MDPPFVERKLDSHDTGKILTFVAESERIIAVKSRDPYVDCHFIPYVYSNLRI